MGVTRKSCYYHCSCYFLNSWNIALFCSKLIETSDFLNFRSLKLDKYSTWTSSTSVQHPIMNLEIRPVCIYLLSMRLWWTFNWLFFLSIQLSLAFCFVYLNYGCNIVNTLIIYSMYHITYASFFHFLFSKQPNMLGLIVVSDVTSLNPPPASHSSHRASMHEKNNILDHWT